MALYLNSSLFRNVFSTPEMRSVFDDDHYFETFMAVEAALARAEARAGLIPTEAADAITEKATLEHLDLSIVEELVAETGHPAMSIIGGWKPAFDEAGEYIHWGATTQDITDLTMVLLVREAIEIVERDLETVRDQLVALAEEHRSTPMIGRTHYVHAVPITFGLKVAVWIDEIDRHLERIATVRERALVLQFFGATGTMASLGEDGLEVQTNLGAELDLPVPDVCWHAARDRNAEIVGTVAMATSTLAKVANQVLVAHRPEIHEFRETPSAGHIGSSTMPHKLNPKRSELIVALSRLVRGQSDVMNEVMGIVDERDATTWYDEFAILPNTFLFTSRMLANMTDLLETLEVHPDRMLENLDIYGGLIASERVMMALAEELGRQTAHEVVSEAARASLGGDRSFLEELESDPRVSAVFARDELEPLVDARTYTGLSEHFVDRVLDHHR